MDILTKKSKWPKKTGKIILRSRTIRKLVKKQYNQ